jgi:hypothetical protein
MGIGRNLNRGVHDRTLEQNPPSPMWVQRGWKISHLDITKDPTKEDLLIAVLTLEREGQPESEKNQIPVTVTLSFIIRVQGREIPLLTGFLNRFVETEEQIQGPSVFTERLMEQIQQLREEVEDLHNENNALKHSLTSIQRPKRAS